MRPSKVVGLVQPWVAYADALEAENKALRLNYIAAVGQAQDSLEELDALREAAQAVVDKTNSDYYSKAGREIPCRFL